ncbi:MAG TPA: transcription termination/antitermination NusG family protein [Acidisarcina sp.]
MTQPTQSPHMERISGGTLMRSSTQAGCYAVKVRSRGEATVGNALRSKGFDVLLPTYTDARRYSDRVKEVKCALFPGYVFVRLTGEGLLPLVSTEGVSYIVKSGGQLRPLLDEEAAAIESLCNSGEDCQPCENYRVGQRVSIASGPLVGLTGILVRVGENDRLIISINSIFSSVSVDVRDIVLQPAER